MEIMVENLLKEFVVVEFIFINIFYVKVEVVEKFVKLEVGVVVLDFEVDKQKEKYVIGDFGFVKLEVGDEKMNVDFLVDRVVEGNEFQLENVGNVRD